MFMKITAVFLSKKNSNKKNIINNIKKQNNNIVNFKLSKIIYIIVVIFGIIVLAKYIPVSPNVIYFASNFRQAEGKNVKISDVLNIYGIYNKGNYIFDESIPIEKAEKLDPQKDAIEILDNIVKDKNEQSVFGEKNETNVEITENSENIQRINLNKMKILNYSSKRELDFKTLATSNITLTKKSDKILLYNTHTSESYANSEKYKYEYSGARRTLDAN